MKRANLSKLLIGLLGLALLIPDAVAWQLGDLRAQTGPFLMTFFVAFAIYAVVTVLALRVRTLNRTELIGCFLLATLMHSILIFTRPTLSDDMYRYVWEGRLQGHGFSPYLHPPGDPAVAHLRDEVIWPAVNRKNAITVYPPAAETAFALLWRLWPDSVRWFQIAMSAGALLAGVLLVGLLRALALPDARVLVYLWSPLLSFETAHGAHLDGLVLPLLVGAWWARVRRRDTVVGLLLGAAVALKLYPLLLVPALWRPHHPQGRWRMPLALGATVLMGYLPHLWWSGVAVVGFLPHYFGERFNVGLAGWLRPLIAQAGFAPDLGLLLVLLGGLAGLAGWMILRPVDDATALRRSIWLIGVFTLLTQNLFSWYLLWILPLVALFLQPGAWGGLRIDAWTGWWLFCGLVALSYTFFIDWRPQPWAIWLQFLPLYTLLLIDLLRRLAVRRLQLRPSNANP